ncbi:MAG: bacteriohemerythrin [Gammaproteobacteria bacterium]|nr:bacteriohemerythrin [Gammaproteobacteria bacterium]
MESAKNSQNSAATHTISDIFTWDDRFETGIPEIDEQHRKLVGLINTLGRILTTETDTEFFEAALFAVFDELTAYVDYHFRFEERLMESHHCQQEHEQEHRKAHAEFSQYIAKARSDAGEHPAEVTGRALTFLSKWLMTHIVGTDMRMAKKLLAIRSGIPEDVATLQVEHHMANTASALFQAMDRLYENLASRTHDLLVAKRALDREVAARRQGEVELRKLSRAVEHSPVSIIITNAAGEFEYVNPKFTRQTGYTIDDLTGKTPGILKSSETPQSVYDTLWDTIRGGREWHGELKNCRKNGEHYWDYVSISPVLDQEGRISHYVSVQEDVTERKKAEERLVQQQEFSESIINSLPGIFYMLDEEGRFIRVNPQFLAVTGYTKPELDKMIAVDFFEDKDKVLISERIREVLDRGESSAEARFIIKSGQKIPYYFTGHRTHIDGRAYIVGLGTDITARYELEQELAHQARTDLLTGLNNRRHFLYLADQELKRAKRYSKPVTMLMLDLDEFKSINDRHGHQTGDKVLLTIGEIFRKTLRESDIAGRLGGEEFAILLPENGMDDSLEVAERLRSEIESTPVSLENGNALRITVSIGVAMLLEDQVSLDQLCNLADQALYEAKWGGRNLVSLYSKA